VAAGVVDPRLSIYVGNKYNDQMEGLCGNFNGRSSDDIGSESSATVSLTDQASAWKSVATCPEPTMLAITEPCQVRFTCTRQSLTRPEDRIKNEHSITKGDVISLQQCY